jgi:5-(carboxyamino)imidazole ribonucleotide synthase
MPNAALADPEGRARDPRGVRALQREISVIAARGRDGAVAAFDPGENVHDDGILRTTTVPAAVPAGLRTDAVLMPRAS